MTRRAIKNVAASVHARLQAKARNSGRPFNELLHYYVMERFLYRLSHSAHVEQLVLKGALALHTYHIEQRRLTRDIDLLSTSSNHLDYLKQVIRDCMLTSVHDDGVQFDPDSLRESEISLDATYQGIRILFDGWLGNALVTMQLDIGFGDAVVPGPIWIDYPELLDFGSPRLLGYTLESTVAEKYQAIVYLDAANSRIKDFYDIWFLSQHFE